MQGTGSSLLIEPLSPEQIAALETEDVALLSTAMSSWLCNTIFSKRPFFSSSAVLLFSSSGTIDCTSVRIRSVISRISSK